MSSTIDLHLSSKTQTLTQTQSKVEFDKIWNVIVLDDPVNQMGYVTMVFRRVFGYNESHAETLMLEVHNEGRSIVWSGDLEEAENYLYQLQHWQLNARLEAYGRHG